MPFQHRFQALRLLYSSIDTIHGRTSTLYYFGIRYHTKNFLGMEKGPSECISARETERTSPIIL